MRIIYVAKHGDHDNQDELAIASALEQLGHLVNRLQETDTGAVIKAAGDFLLFHKWDNSHALRLSPLPKVFWNFDLIDSGDQALLKTSAARRSWMQRILPHCLLGFCTDGDWVKKHSDKLIHLPQGCDERLAGPGIPAMPPCWSDLLFVGGIRGHSLIRQQHLVALKARYGSRLRIVGDGPPKVRLHGRKLADVVASTRIVIAPLGLTTDAYWSNRVYLMLGFQGFLLHPYSEGLAQQYQDGRELVFYHDEYDLDDKIDFYIHETKTRFEIALAGYNKTIGNHTYRHRCQVLIEEVQKRL